MGFNLSFKGLICPHKKTACLSVLCVGERKGKGKSKVHPRTCHEDPEGE